VSGRKSSVWSNGIRHNSDKLLIIMAKLDSVDNRRLLVRAFYSPLCLSVLHMFTFYFEILNSMGTCSFYPVIIIALFTWRVCGGDYCCCCRSCCCERASCCNFSILPKKLDVNGSQYNDGNQNHRCPLLHPCLPG
jgi:hypothetical protein